MSGSGFDVVKDAQNVSCTTKCVNLAGVFQGFPYQGDVRERWCYRKVYSAFPFIGEKYLLLVEKLLCN
jgi:hypothetical protein